MSNKATYEAAWKKWGNMQWIVLMEECAELQQAVSKYLRADVESRAAEMIAEEAADVLIMIDQIKTLNPSLSAEISEQRKKKLKRLSQIVK